MKVIYNSNIFKGSILKIYCFPIPSFQCSCKPFIITSGINLFCSGSMKSPSPSALHLASNSSDILLALYRPLNQRSTVLHSAIQGGYHCHFLFYDQVN